jgi:hypothetical protein
VSYTDGPAPIETFNGEAALNIARMIAEETGCSVVVRDDQSQRRCTVRPRRQEASLGKAKAEEKLMTALPQLVPNAEPRIQCS